MGRHKQPPTEGLGLGRQGKHRSGGSARRALDSSADTPPPLKLPGSEYLEVELSGMRPLSILRGVSRSTGLIFVLLSIPLAFDVGSEECGLSFTCLLSVVYFTLSTLRLILRRTRLRVLASFLYYAQFLAIPSMLLLHLSKCPTGSGSDSATDMGYTLLVKNMWPWKLSLEYATGLFSLLEGFCTLIVIQACGRASTAMSRRSDGLLLLILFVASIMLTADIYLLVRIYMFPDIITAATATLIGAALTICLSLGTYGIWSRKGNVVESTLLFSYIMYQIYLTFTDFQKAGNALETSAPNLIWSLFASDPVEGQGYHLLGDVPIPPVIIDSYTEFMKVVTELTPAGIKTMAVFTKAALRGIIPSVCVSLAVRLSSYFIAMRLVPYVRRQALSRHMDNPPNEKLVLLIAYAYSPILIIMVYTHLLLQHFEHIVHVSPRGSSRLTFDITKIWVNSREAWQFWGWINVFLTLAVYGAELTMSPAGDAPGTPTEEDEGEMLEIR